MTRALLRHRIETKLLAQAAANKVGGSPERHGRPGQGSYDEGQVHATRCRSAARCGTSWSRTRRSPTSSTRSSRPPTRASRALAKQYSTDRHEGDGRRARRRPTARSLVKPFADVAFTIRPGRRLDSRSRSQFGWHLIEAEGPVLPAGTRPLDATLKLQIRTQLEQEGAPEEHREAVRRGRDRAEQEHPVRAGLRPAHRVDAVTDGAERAPRALIVALGPGEPELVPAAGARGAAAQAGSVAPHELPDALRTRLDEPAASSSTSGAPTVCAPDCSPPMRSRAACPRMPHAAGARRCSRARRRRLRRARCSS